MISVIKETYAVRLLPLYFRTGCDLEGVRVPFCGCLETLAVQESSLFHGSKEKEPPWELQTSWRGRKRSPGCLKQVSPQEIMVELWLINDGFLFFSSC